MKNCVAISAILTAWAACSFAAAGGAETGLVAHYAFAEGKGNVAHDQSGNKLDGAVHGAEWVSFGPIQALKFDGDDDYVDCGKSASLNFLDQPFSLECWVKTDARSSTVIAMGKIGGNRQNYWLGATGGSARFSVGNGERFVLVSGPRINNDQWRHLVGVRDTAGGVIRLYVDGAQAGTAKDGLGPITPNGIFAIGRFGVRPSNFPGLIDEVRVYSRALSPAEIADHYGKGWPDRKAAQGVKATDVTPSEDAMGKPPVKYLPIKGEVFAVEKRTAFAILPTSAKQSSPIPWVWYAPTLPPYPSSTEKWMFEQFLNEGIAIAGVDVGESFGSPAGRAVYSALYDELVHKRGFSAKPCLLARSRGGLMLYNWAAENPASVSGVAGIYPVCNIVSYPGFSRACRAYGLTEEQLEAEVTRHNPIDRLTGLARARVPIFHIHGDSDTTVPLDENSAELAKRYRQLGGEMTLVVAKGQGHNMWTGFFECQDLVDFIITHAKAKGSDAADHP